MSRRDGSTRHDRLATLQQRLRDQPDDPRAWYWQVRIKVLTYCVNKGGGEEAIGSEHDRPPPAQFSPGERWPGIRSRQEIRKILRRIAAPDRGESPSLRAWRFVQHILGPGFTSRVV